MKKSGMITIIIGVVILIFAMLTNKDWSMILFLYSLPIILIGIIISINKNEDRIEKIKRR